MLIPNCLAALDCFYDDGMNDEPAEMEYSLRGMLKHKTSYLYRMRNLEVAYFSDRVNIQLNTRGTGAIVQGRSEKLSGNFLEVCLIAAYIAPLGFFLSSARKTASSS